MTGAGWPTQFRVWLPMACVITVTGLRAKSGKTTVAVNLAASFVMEGYACMLIDLAGTADASRALGVSVTTGAFAASAVLGGQASLMAVRLPTLLAGVAGSSVAQTRYVLDALDRLNALTRWGLVAAPLLVESAPAFAIESTGQSLYARMNREELLAYTPTSDGLVFASNLAVLERLLRTRTPGATSNAFPLADGLNRLHEGTARASLWFNAAEGAKVVRLGVTAWSLKLLLEDAQGSQATRQRMNEFKAWMDALAPLGQVRLDVTEKEQRAVFTLEAGVP